MIYWLISRQNLKYLAWGLIPLAAVIAILLLFFRVPPEQQLPLPEVIEQGPDYLQVQLGDGSPTTIGNLREQFVPLAATRRDRLLNRLSEFRAKYKQSSPRLRVWARPGLDSRRRLAESLGGSLAQVGLGHRIDVLPGPLPTTEIPVVLVCAERDRRIARRLLAALSLQLSGPVELRFDDTVNLDRMALYLLGEPGFTAEGVALFGPQP